MVYSKMIRKMYNARRESVRCNAVGLHSKAARMLWGIAEGVNTEMERYKVLHDEWSHQ
jgi:hypothetical protein